MTAVSQSDTTSARDKSPRHQSTRDRIVLAAGPIFAEKGFDAATVREICQSAEVNVASVNYHFGDKQNLYHETVLYAHSCRAGSPSDRVEDDAAAPTDRLRQNIERILFSMVVNEAGPWQVRLLMNEIQNPTETCRQLVRDEFRPFVRQLMKNIVAVANEPLSNQLQSTLAMSVIGQCMIYRFAPTAHVMTVSADDGDVENSHQPSTPTDLTQLSRIITSFSIAGIRAAVRDL